MRPRPHSVCQTSGRSTMASVIPSASGCGYSVTAVCQAGPPSKAARLFQRWFSVQTPSGTIASAEPSRSLMKLERDGEGAAAWVVAVLTGSNSYQNLGQARPPLEDRAPLGEH